MTNQLLYLVIHCTDTPEGRFVSKEDILHWHTDPVSKGGHGWSRPGYSEIVYLDGSLINLVPYNSDEVIDNSEITNGALGMNDNSHHTVYAGGMDADMKHPKDTRTAEQKDTLEIVVKYMLKVHPHILVLGHGEAPNQGGRACPSFDVPAWLRALGVAEKNIFSSPENKNNPAVTRLYTHTAPPVLSAVENKSVPDTPNAATEDTKQEEHK